MKNRFLYVTDLHLRSRAPARRVDEWPAAAFDKLRWVVETAKARDVDFILCGGDFFDGPRPGYGVVSGVVDVIGGGPPWVSLIGNHDVVGHRAGSVDSTGFGVLSRTPDFRPAPEFLGDEEMSLTCYHYHHGIDVRTDFPSRSAARVKIVAAHSMILDRPAPFDHVLIRDVETDADLFLCSHYHPGWKPTFARGTVFVHPGALVRLSVREARRRPGVLIVDVEWDKVRVEVVEVPVGESVFDVRGARRDAALTSRINEFMAAMESAEFQGLDLRSRVEAAGRDGVVDPSVAALVVQEIDSVVEERSGG